MSLLSAAERLSAIDRSALLLDTQRCLHSRDQFSACEACFDVCPVDAIRPGRPPVLETEKCKVCLACIPACPVGAYAADDAVPALLNCAIRLKAGRVELICTMHPNPEKGVSAESVAVRVRGCLAGLGIGTYLTLAALGLQQIEVRTDACGDCAWSGLRARVEVQVDRARQLFAAWDRREALVCVSNLEAPVVRLFWQAENPPLSRRDLFRLAARQGQVAVARAVEDGGAAAGRRPGRDRLRLLGAVAHLPAPQPGYIGSLMGMDFAWVSVSEACTACAACARACPTSALQFERSKEETAYTLTFSARNCVGCEMCVHVCAPSALTMDRTPTFAQIFSEEIVTLQKGGLVKCERCGALTAAQSGVNLCPLCEYRRTHPFGSMLPPGLKGIRPPVAEEKRA